MKIAIMIYSKTGITKELANSLSAKLCSMGNEVELFALETEGAVNPGEMSFQITNLPDLSAYDLLYIGSPVWAFHACPVIIKAIAEVIGIGGKKVIPFVTMHFPYKFMGGSNSLRGISKTLRKRNALPQKGMCAHKVWQDFEVHIADVANALSQMAR